MKKILYLLLMIPAMVWAQTDAKYLAGAVPVVDGRVTFTQTINVPGLTKDVLFNYLDTWAKEQFKAMDGFPNNRLISEDAATGEIGAIGEAYVVFSNSVLSLDRTRMYYQFTAKCSDGKCQMTISRIRYLYNEARNGGERYTAEEIITDETGLNKKKDKLARVIGKFRRETIDYKDNLFKSVSTSIMEQLQQTAKAAQPKEETPAVQIADPSVVTIDPAAIQAAQTAPTTTVAVPAVTVATATVATTATPSNSDMEGYRKVEVRDIPGNIYKLLSEDWMLITAGNGTQFNMMTASWGGLGNLYQKPVAFCFINPSRYTYQLMEKGDTYTLSFYNESSREALKVCGTTSGRDGDKVKASGLTPITTPSGNKAFKEAWLIIECKKMIAQSFNPDVVKQEELKQQWEGKAMHKMYIGEIVNVWMK